MTNDKPFNLQDYLAIGLRRKWYIIIPVVVCTIGSYGVYKYLPKGYKATTLILVQPQRVPESYVRSTVTDSIADRLDTIGQEILSRTRLEQVIDEFGLFAEIRNKVPMEQLVATMRKTIDVKVESRSQGGRSQNAFSISYEGKIPKEVMSVTNKLASLFIEENLMAREQRAEGTSEFLGKELVALEEQLKKKEQDIRYFKERSMGQLPQQLDANLRILERIQQQLQMTSENIWSAVERSIVVQNQIEMVTKREPVQAAREVRRDPATGLETLSNGRSQEDPLVTQLNNLKRDLNTSQSRYKETHPDIIDMKKRIAILEPRVKEILEKEESDRQERLRGHRARSEGVTVENLSPPAPDPETQRLLTQYTEQYNVAVLDAKRLREEEKGLKEQIALYQKRIEDTPRKEQELTLLTRDYELLRTNYQQMLNNKMQAQMAENLEKKQQGEQFKILDPARLPVTPISPDRKKIFMMGAMMGLALGLGLAWFRESLDKSFRTVAEVESELGFQVLATIPNLRGEMKKERKAA